MAEVRSIGIIGAGRVGTAIARRALQAGYDVRVATARPPAEMALMLGFVAPGARPGTIAEVAAGSDLVVLALPLSKYKTLPPEWFQGRIVVDAMNYWAPTDGVLPEFEAARPSSAVIADHLVGARLLRAFNHMGYHEIDDLARPAGDPDRRAMAIAGDDAGARRVLAGVIDRMGFDPVDAGPLARARLFEVGTPVFGAMLGRADLGRALALPAAA